ARFIRALGAETGLERQLATEAADCSWRYDRARGVDAAVLELRALQTRHGNLEQQKREVAALAARITTEPVEAVSKLRESVLGCEYLLEQWRYIGLTLHHGQGVHRSQRAWGICLAGHRTAEVFYDKHLENWYRFCLGYLINDEEPNGTPEARFHEQF